MPLCNDDEHDEEEDVDDEQEEDEEDEEEDKEQNEDEEEEEEEGEETESDHVHTPHPCRSPLSHRPSYRAPSLVSTPSPCFLSSYQPPIQILTWQKL